MALLARAGLNAYRFSLEWARIEPEPGEFSRAQLAHYRRMIDTALTTGLTPLVMLHHFTHPAWFAARGGWDAPGALDRVAKYVERAISILDDVDWVVTINEPNILAMMLGTMKARAAAQSAPGLSSAQTPLPDERIGARLQDAHRRAVELVRAGTSAKVGWSIGQQAFIPAPGNEEIFHPHVVDVGRHVPRDGAR
jgi:beta-glucosidase